MKINQPKFKMRKPIGLTLDFLDTQQQQKEQTPKIQEIDTFEEFCSQIPENQQQHEINFSKQSQSFHSQQLKSEKNNKDESICSELKQSIQHTDREKESSQIQYIVFEEFHPQSTVISQSESIKTSEKQSQPSETSIIKEPPAPSNKNNTKFSFPQKGTGFSGPIPEVEHTNTSSYEQTMIKQQLKQNQINNIADMELKQQIFSLQRDKEQIKNQYKLEIIELNARIQDLQSKLDIEQATSLQLKQENEKLQGKLSQFEHQYSITNDRNQSEQISVSYPNKMTENDKIQYLIEKLNQKSTLNAKLQYEIFKLQNNIELLQTKQIVQSYNVNQVSEHEPLSDSHSPPQFGTHPPYKSRENKASVLMQQKQVLLNLSANQQQLDQRQTINLQVQHAYLRSNMISPQAKTCKASAGIHKNLTTHQPKTAQFKEDTLQHLRKMQSAKNSTSVGELNTFKQDLTNCSNILQKIMRKDSTQSPDKPIQATQKFKEALNSKLQNIPDKHKSYASLLFSLGDFTRPRVQDAYIRQNSPHVNEEIQLKSRQMFAFQPHPNSRKQSETIKSEESHKVSADQPKYQDKFDYPNYQRKGKFTSTLDILQLMRDIKSQKIGISTKINQKKTHLKYEKQYNLCQYKGSYY